MKLFKLEVVYEIPPEQENGDQCFICFVEQNCYKRNPEEGSERKKREYEIRIAKVNGPFFDVGTA